MTAHDFSDDPMLDALRGLREYDVSARRAQRLRDRCHTALRRHTNAPAHPRDAGTSRSRWTAGLLAGAWCCVYVFETIRRIAAVYRLE